MSAVDTGPIPDPQPSGEGPSVPGEADRPGPSPAAGTPRPAAWIVALAIALVAGLAAWLVGERFSGYYAPSDEASTSLYMLPRLRQEKAVADSRNAAIA